MIKTKQELLNHFSDINAMYNNPFMYQTLSNMIDELLEQQPCEDAISKQAVLDLATTIETDDYSGNEVLEVVEVEEIKNLPPVTPQTKIDEIIKRIEEARDKDRIAEYPYNRCIKIIREVLGDD